MSQLAAGTTARAALSAPHDSNRMGHDWLSTLAEVPLFEGLSKRQLRRIAKLARVRRFAPGSTMVRTGDPGKTFYVLLDGTARVVRVNGRARRLGAADGEVLALTIDRPGFMKVLRAEPALAQALLGTLAARLRAAERSDL
jgi:CRP-like cAMP-binding protein